MPKNQKRIIRVEYIEELDTKAHSATYNLPLFFDKPLPSYSLSVRRPYFYYIRIIRQTLALTPLPP
jgi:hypothetical protein